MRIAIISANFGKGKYYQDKHITQDVNDNLEIKYFFLNEEKFPLREHALQPCLQGKIVKMLGYELFPDFDYYVWLDSNITLNDKNSIKWLIDKCYGYDFAFFRHYKRNSVLEEAEYIIKLLKNNNEYLSKRCKYELIEEQIEFYKKKQLFKNDKLFACGAFIYSKSMIFKQEFNIMQQWYYHCCRFNVRDQISLPFLLDVNPIYTFNVIKESLINNIYLKYNSK